MKIQKWSIMQLKKLISFTILIVLAFMFLPQISIVHASEEWLWPAEGCMIISSNFGKRNHGSGVHHGIDIVASSNTSGRPVRASKSGTIYAGCGRFHITRTRQGIGSSRN